MRRRRGPTALAMCLVLAVVASAWGDDGQSVQVSVLTHFASGSPAAVAATNTGDVVALAGTNVVRVGPNGQQKTLDDDPGGAFGIPVGIALRRVPSAVRGGPDVVRAAASGGRGSLKISANGKQRTPVPGSEGMIAPDGFGLDSATGNMYATDIFGNSIWRFTSAVSGAALDFGRDESPARFSRTASRCSNNAVPRLDRGREDPEDPDQPRWNRGNGDRLGARGRSRRLLRRHGARRSHRRRLRDATRQGRAAADHPGGVITLIATHADGILGGGEHDPDSWSGHRCRPAHRPAR